MSAVYTQRWSSYVFGDDRAVIEFDVTGVGNNDLAARNAVPYQKGATHPRDGGLVMLRRPEVQRSLEPFLVRCEFERPQGGDGNNVGTGDDGDPLLAPPRIQWGRTTVSELTDIDIDGNPIRNAAGDQYNPKATREFTSRTVTITKNLTVYPYDLADAYENSINDDDLQVTNSTVVFPKLCVKVLSLMPAGEYAADAKYVPVALTLEVRTSMGNRPFDTRRVNQGRNGWYANATWPPGGDPNLHYYYGPICDPSGNPVTEDVLLAADGRPINKALTVNGNTPQPNPFPPRGWVPDPDAPGPAIVQIWKTSKRLPMSDLFRQLGLGA